MYSGTPVFTQLMEFMPLKTFQRCVERYRGNFGIKHFTCLQVLSVSVFERTSLYQLLTFYDYTNDTDSNDNQVNLFTDYSGQ